MRSSNAFPPFAVIYGATASGKTALSLTLARAGPGVEIISADSCQIYRYLDIGTNKVTADERRMIPHHLIDIRDPDGRYDVFQFITDTKKLISDIHARGHWPLIVGGTALYLHALINGLTRAPERNETLRDRFRAQEAESPGWLWARIQEVDPTYAGTIHPNDETRQLRALEVYESAGLRMSAMAAAREALDPSPLFFYLQIDRSELRERIHQRAKQMVDQGIISETEHALAMGYSRQCSGLNTIGYKEVCRYLAGAIDRPGLIEEISTHTWHYAKKQMRWFRQMAGIEVVSPKMDLRPRLTRYFCER